MYYFLSIKPIITKKSFIELCITVKKSRHFSYLRIFFLNAENNIIDSCWVIIQNWSIHSWFEMIVLEEYYSSCVGHPVALYCQHLGIQQNKLIKNIITQITLSLCIIKQQNPSWYFFFFLQSLIGMFGIVFICLFVPLEQAT